ncbi:N-acetyltransferase family protein [Sphingomonas sp.]|uniref:GNAT family N-acetyltransferase n=1 Tax=Sphingomonas sp. TaxID=28214 RepID=UPI003CC539EF
MIAYRDATPADGAALNAMATLAFRQTFAAEYERADLEEYIGRAYGPAGLLADLADPAVRFRLALSGEAIVGYAKLSPLALPLDDAEPGATELRQLYLLRDRHGSGIAATLMDWTIAEARAAGAPALYLAVFDFNHRAKAFYARYGFVDVGCVPFRLGERVDMDRVWRLSL